MPRTLAPRQRLRPWMAWLGLVVPAALSWWWATREPRARAEAEVAQTLQAARSRASALEARFNSFRRLVADLSEEPSLAAALSGRDPGAAARQLNLVAKAGSASIDRIELYDNGGVPVSGWTFNPRLDDFLPWTPKPAPRLDLRYVQAALRSPRGATWIGASQGEGLEDLALHSDGPVLPSAHVAVPVYGREEGPAGVLAIRVRLDDENLQPPGGAEPWLILGEQGEFIMRPAQAASWVRYLPSARRLQTFEEAFGKPLSELSAESGALGLPSGLLCYRRVRVDHRSDWVLLRPYARESLLSVGHETLHRIGVLWVLSLLLCGTAWWALNRRDLAHAQEAQRQLLQATLNASRDLAIFATGPDGVIRFFSAGAERMLGFAAEEVIGRFHMTDFLVPAEAPEAARAFQASGEHAAPSHESQSLEVVPPGGRRTWTYRDVADRHFPVFLTSTAMRDRTGSVLGHVVVAQDARPTLERERGLEAAAREAREAERLKSTFLAVMSHEVRTPMNAIMGMVRLLRRTPLDAEQLEITQVGERAARNLLDLLDGVLDYTKVEAGKMEFVSAPFSPRALTEECAALWRLQAGAKGLAFTFHAPDRVPLALGDAQRLRQVLNNLLGNALKFTETGGVELQLSAELRAGRVALQWEVLDTGPGIPEEALERIFEPFTQAEGSTSRRHGGTGLGLALCRELARLMGGTLQVQSVPGKGTRFTLHLELQPGEEDPRTAPA